MRAYSSSTGPEGVHERGGVETVEGVEVPDTDVEVPLTLMGLDGKGSFRK